MDVNVRFDAKITPSLDGCLLYTGAIQNGYGVFSVGGKSVKAHRFSYERANGSIGAGMTIDHECHNRAAAEGRCKGGASCRHRACVNPAHLVERASGDNTLRGLGPAALNARKVLCSRGHSLPHDRRCRECSAEDVRKWQAENQDYMTRKVLCPRCNRPRNSIQMARHLEKCMVPGRRKSDRPRPGAIQCNCGLWVSKSNLARHRRNCPLQYVQFDDGGERDA